DSRQHVRSVGELRDHVVADEGRHLESLQAGRSEHVDQAHLVGRGDDLGLVLKPVARPDLTDSDACWDLSHGAKSTNPARRIRSARLHYADVDHAALVSADADRPGTLAYLDLEAELAAVGDLVEDGPDRTRSAAAAAATCLMQTSKPTVALPSGRFS